MPFPRLPPGAAHQAAASLPLLLPFHCPPSHSMTGGNVSNRIKEQYPWGRYRWLDSLLGLPVKRQRLFLSHRLATSPLSNALGCLVFLGTPFYVKKWERNGVRRLVLATVASIVVMLAVIAVAERSAVARKSLDAPYLTPLIASALILVFATISVSIEVSRSTAFYSGNIYHSPDFDWSHAMSALVVHAGKLDEASLALSSEPIARAYVFPHLANMLKLPFWKPLPQFPPHDAVPLDWLLYIASFGRILLWNIIFILPALILSLLSHIVAPLVIGAVRNVIVVISFGLAQNELSFAHVFMDEILDLGLSSQHVEHWNVQKLLALAKTRSLQGELMAGYEDDTCDMGEAVFEAGLLGEGLSEEGVPGKIVDGRNGEGIKEHQSKQPAGREEHDSTTKNGEVLKRGEKRGAAENLGHVMGSVNEGATEGKTHGEEQLLYEYLWDDKELDEAAAKCLTYQCLKPEIKKMWRNPRLTPEESVRQIKELCVMIEDRFKELTGKFDLNHGAYFRDPRILGVVAHFLEFRELPEWSKAIDTDVMRAEHMVHSS
ncbi:unnamed protein product [Closterium sp. NIES-65]|nr:unnamed protein product [Closterium sp. NIES-65]